MLMRVTVFALMLTCCTFALAAEPEGMAPAIVPLEGIALKLKDRFPRGSALKPTKIASLDEAKQYFSDDNLDKLQEKIDFDKQFVLIFRWAGSGQDRLTYFVAESFPEQIHFTYQRGKTRDLRRHLHIFALRNNVKWSVK